MCLLYRDARGRTISRTQWEELFRTPGYGEPRSYRVGPYEARLSWVGVASVRESEPRVWLVEIVVGTHGGSRVLSVGLPVFCAQRETAEQEYARAMLTCARMVKQGVMADVG